ncbi:hypothetical protein GCM10027162_66110 [Streptomyces incanus]
MLTEAGTEDVAAGEFRCPDPTGTVLRARALFEEPSVQLTSSAGAVPRARAWVNEAPARELGQEEPAGRAR